MQNTATGEVLHMRAYVFAQRINTRTQYTDAKHPLTKPAVRLRAR